MISMNLIVALAQKWGATILWRGNRFGEGIM